MEGVNVHTDATVVVVVFVFGGFHCGAAIVALSIHYGHCSTCLCENQRRILYVLWRSSACAAREVLMEVEHRHK